MIILGVLGLILFNVNTFAISPMHQYHCFLISWRNAHTNINYTNPTNALKLVPNCLYLILFTSKEGSTLCSVHPKDIYCYSFLECIHSRFFLDWLAPSFKETRVYNFWSIGYSKQKDAGMPEPFPEGHLYSHRIN